MPFTPFHMGPGLLVKGVADRHFSVMVFGFSQVAIDLEPLVHIVRRDSYHHGHLHTWLGAAVVAGLSYAVGRPACARVLRVIARNCEKRDWAFGKPWIGEASISRFAALSAAIVGAYSHVVLDAIQHWDVEPMLPIAEGNPYYHALSTAALHVGCVTTGVIGVIACILRVRSRSGAERRDRSSIV